MAWTTYKVTSKTKDPRNANVVVAAEFFDDANPSATHSASTFAYDLTDERIDDWARKTIDVLNARDAAFEAITVGEAKQPQPADNTKQRAIAEAQLAYRKAAEKAQVAKLADAETSAAYAELIRLQEGK